MGAAVCRHCHLRPACLGDGADLPRGAAAAGPFRQRGRDRADDRRRHSGRQGRLPESRPDGLRQPLRHGLLLWRGLHRLDPRGAGYSDAKQCRAGHVGQAVCGAVGRSAGRRRRRDAPCPARRGLDQAGGRAVRPLGGCLGDGARRSGQDAGHRQSHRRLDPGLQPHAAARRQDRGFSGVLRADNSGAAAWHDLVLDRELALRAHGRQYAHHQHVQMDLDQLLLHLLCLRRGHLHL